MILLKIIFWLLLSIGLVIFFKYMAIPYAKWQYKLWRFKRAMRKMAKGKPPELQKALNQFADALGDVMKQDKM